MKSFLETKNEVKLLRDETQVMLVLHRLRMHTTIQEFGI